MIHAVDDNSSVHTASRITRQTLVKVGLREVGVGIKNRKLVYAIHLIAPLFLQRFDR